MFNIENLIAADNAKQSAKLIEREAAKIAKAASKTGEQLYRVLLSAVQHAVTFNDVRLIDRVFAAVPQSVARGKISVWLTSLSNMSARKDDDGNVIFRKPKDSGLEIDFDAMLSVSPWDYSVDPTETEFDFDKKLSQLLNTAAGKVKKGKPVKGSLTELETKVNAIAAFAKTLATPVDATVN